MACAVLLRGGGEGDLPRRMMMQGAGLGLGDESERCVLCAVYGVGWW